MLNNNQRSQEKLQVKTTLMDYPKKSSNIVSKIPETDSANNYDNNYIFEEERL